MYADLHIHTTASDGSDSPREVIYKAVKLGLKAIAITDHDTFGGIQDALHVSREVDLEVLAGIELSTEYQNREIHILGYLMDVEDKTFASHLVSFRKARCNRIGKIVKKLQELNLSLTLNDVYEKAGDGSIGRLHVARVLLGKGIVGSIKEAFDKYIGKGAVAYVPRLKCTPYQAVKLIRSAGGVAVLAHPALVDVEDYIPYLIEAGLQGLEVYHPQHKPFDIEHYLGLTRRFGLIATGGSDYHGGDTKGFEVFGKYTVNYSVVEELRKLAGK